MTRAARRAAGRALIAACACLAAGCGEDGKPAGSAASSATAAESAASAAQQRTAAPAGKPAAPPSDAVDLLKFELTSGVKAKDPIDALDAAKPGQRVYGHVTVRNRTDGPRRVSLSFRVNDDERTLVDLTIEKSWSWRSWAYVTLRKDDRGELTVHVFDDHGAELGKKSIPIR